MKMTFSRYKRLLLVSFIPLLLAGAILSFSAYPYGRTDLILCTSDFLFGENCRTVGYDDHRPDPRSDPSSLYSSVKKQHTAWFQIYPESESKFINTYIEGSTRVLTGVSIVNAKAFFGSSDEVASYVRNLIGKTGVIFLGGRTDSRRRSLALGDNVLLYCNDLRYAANGTYTSLCFGEGWSGYIDYTVSNESGEMLSALNFEVSRKMRETVRGFIAYWIVGIPIFLFAFLVLSLTFYLLYRAYRYVCKAYSYVKEG